MTRARTYVKRARTTIDEGDTAASRETVEKAVSELDRAVSKGVLHSNNAARKKRRLMARLNSMESEAKPSK
jgi:small subunit ribosomal protein S20